MPEETFNTIIKFMLVVAVVIVVVLVIKGPGWTLVKSYLKIGSELTETPETQEVIKKKFDNLIKIYRDCIEKEKVNCICEDRKFDEFEFPKNYVLNYEAKKIILNKILINKPEQEIQSYETDKKFSCVMKENIKEYEESPLKISYEEKPFTINDKYKIMDVPFAFKVDKDTICFIAVEPKWFSNPEEEIKANLKNKETC